MTQLILKKRAFTKDQYGHTVPTFPNPITYNTGIDQFGTAPVILIQPTSVQERMLVEGYQTKDILKIFFGPIFHTNPDPEFQDEIIYLTHTYQIRTPQPHEIGGQVVYYDALIERTVTDT